MRGITSIVVAALVIGSLPSVSRAEDPVTFADPNLQAAVEAELGVSNPTPTDMLALTQLEANEQGITELIGLEYAVNLKDVDLSFNQISDISALTGLANLANVNLAANQITDISPFVGLTNLQQLGLTENQISDISALAGLMGLTYLNLRSNSLNAEAYVTYIPVIVANNPGLEIYYDPYGTVAVYRFWSPVYERHFYTTKESEKDLSLIHI